MEKIVIGREEERRKIRARSVGRGEGAAGGGDGGRGGISPVAVVAAVGRRVVSQLSSTHKADFLKHGSIQSTHLPFILHSTLVLFPQVAPPDTLLSNRCSTQIRSSAPSTTLIFDSQELTACYRLLATLRSSFIYLRQLLNPIKID